MKKAAKYLSYGALAAVIIMMVAATVLEKLRGTDYALNHFYYSPLFFVFWAVMAVCGMAYLVYKGGHKHIFTFLLHVSLVLILAGALVTHLTGISGGISLRTGEECSKVELEDGTAMELPFSLRLDDRALSQLRRSHGLQERGDGTPFRGGVHHLHEPYPQIWRVPFLSG